MSPEWLQWVIAGAVEASIEEKPWRRSHISMVRKVDRMSKAKQAKGEQAAFGDPRVQVRVIPKFKKERPASGGESTRAGGATDG